MRQATSFLSSFFYRTNVFIADSPSDYGNSLRARVLKLTRDQLCRRSGLALRLLSLDRRFPIDKEAWDNLLRHAPERCEELLRQRNSDLLIWIKADRSHKRFKLQALTPLEKQETLSPLDISLAELEPIPVNNLSQYGPLISLFVLAQLPVPDKNDKQKFHEYAVKVKELSPYLDAALSSPASNMPDSFHFALRRFQAWAWFISGTVCEDTAKLGRAMRAYETLLSDWPKSRGEFELGQTLSNLASISLVQAHLISGMEAYETALDHIDNAQKVFVRTRYPTAWAQLQEMRAEAQINLGERHSDAVHFEASIHTLQTVKRVWISQERTGRLAKVQKRTGEVLLQLGHLTPGVERLEQASSAFYGAINAYVDIGDAIEEGTTRLALSRTLIDLGERAGNKDRLEDAVKVISRAKTLLRRDREAQISCNIAEAHALTRLGCQYSENIEAEKYLKQAINYLTQILHSGSKLEIFDKIRVLEFLGIALGHSGKQSRAVHLLDQSSDYYRQAIEIIVSSDSNGQKHIVPSHILGRFYGQLARNYSWAGRLSLQTKLLEEATAVYQKAIEYIDREKMSRDWALLQSELADNLIFTAKHNNGLGADLADLAIQAYHKSLSALQRERAPLLWAQIKNSLAEALALSGAMGGGVPCFELAIEAYSKALEEWKPGSSSMERAGALNNMANVLADLGRREADEQKLEEACEAFSEAYDLYSSLGHTSFAERVHDNIAAISDLVANDFSVDTNRLFDQPHLL